MKNKPIYDITINGNIIFFIDYFGGDLVSIVVKFITKSILEKKFRSFIIIFSVTISAALFFASSGLAGTMSSMYETLIRMQTGKADLIIYPNRQSPSSVLKILPHEVEGIDYIVGDLSVGGVYKLSKEEAQNLKIKTEKLYIKGFEIEELEKFNPVNYSQKAIEKDFIDNCIILSKLFADKYGYNVGDRIDIEVGGVNKILTVWGISRPTGIFQHSPQSDSMMAVMPLDTLASTFNMRGKAHNAYVVLEEGADMQTVKNELSALYPRYTVQEPFTADELNEYLQFIVVPLYLMTIMVLFISIFIIYSTFKVESWQGIKVVGTDNNIGYLQGIDISKYRDYVAFRLDGKENSDELFEKLDDGRNIMVTIMLRDTLGLKIGDKLTLDMRTGEKTYSIIGFYDSIMQNGSNAIISQKYFKTDMEQSYYNTFYVITSKEPDYVLSLIKEKFMRQGVWGNTISYMEERNYEQNSQFMFILKAFSVLAMLIGIFGVFNNYMISFLERKHSIAIKRSIGLSKRQTLKMIFVEALTGGCIGSIVGIIGAMLMLQIVPRLMQSIGVPLAIHYKFSLFVSSLIAGIIISVIASISPALKTSRLDIIESIKYE